MSLSATNLLARLDELKKWQKIQQEKLLKQHAKRLEDVENNYKPVANNNEIETNSLQEEENVPLPKSEVIVNKKPEIAATNKENAENLPKPKRPFLKRGSGLTRFKMKPGEQYKPFKSTNLVTTDCSITSTPTCSKENDENKKQLTPLKRPEISIKPKATWSNAIEPPTLYSNVLNEPDLIGKINELALQTDSTTTTQSNTSCNSPTNTKSSLQESFNETDDITILGEQTTDKELRIFEDLEERAMNSSFCSTNSSIIRMLESTPKKSKVTIKPTENNAGHYSVITRDAYENIRKDNNLDIRSLIQANLHKLQLNEIVEEEDNNDDDYNKHFCQNNGQCRKNQENDRIQTENNRIQTEFDQIEDELSSNNSHESSGHFQDEDTWSDTNPPSETKESVPSFSNIAIQTDFIPIKCNCGDTLKSRLKKLDEEIDSFHEENLKIRNIKRELEEEQRKLGRDRKKLEKELEEERMQMEFALEEDKKKLNKEKMVFERYVKDSQNKPSKKERQEITSLKLEIDNLKETLKLKETRNATTQARLRNQVKSLEKDNTNLKEEIDKLSKLNAKLTVNQRLNVRKPSDTKMLHEINKNLTKLAKNKKTNESAKKNTNKSKVVIVNSSSSESESDDSEDSLKETTTRRTLRSSDTPLVTNPKNMTENQQVPLIPPNLEPTSFTKPPLTLLQQRHSLENVENDRNSLNTDSSFKNLNDISLERNYEKIFGEFEPPHRLSSNSLNETQKNVGTVERKLEDGSTEFTYPNGNVKIITPDGNTITVKYYNGDIKETRLLDGSIRYYYKENEIWHTTFADGNEILEFPNGQTEKRFPDGSLEVYFQSGVVRRLEKNGVEKLTYPDGTIVTTNSNGEKIMLLPNGQKEIHTNEHKRREYPDGTVKILYPDGLQETRYSNGRIRLKDKNGRLLMDSHEDVT